MKIIKHVLSQPFLLAVSLAALAHSSWSFSTLFTGLEPDPQFSGAWFAWLVPGVLLAFSVDIGLLSLANQIRVGNRGRGKLVAFAVLCAAMAFLQFLYIAHHAPAVSLGAGVRAEWIPLVALIRDAAIWVLPCLLPVALCLFAFSDEAHSPTAAPSTALALVGQDGLEPISIEMPPELAEHQSETLRPSIDDKLAAFAVELTEIIMTRVDAKSAPVELECDHPGCDWAVSRPTQQGALNALNAHKRKHKSEPVPMVQG